MKYDKTDYTGRKEEILQWVSESLPKAEIAKRLGCKAGKINGILAKFNVVYKGNQGSQGHKAGKYKTAEEYLNQGKYVSSHKLRVKLLKEGVKEHKCEICGIFEWMGKPVPLELDHIDGDHFNNTMENLRVICPNCHAQTDTYAGKRNKRK